MLFGRSGRASQRVRVRVCAPVLIPNPSQAFPTCSSSKCTESVRGCHERERLPTVLFHFDHCRSVERPSCCSTPNVLASSPNNPSCRIDGLLWVSPGKIRLQVQVGKNQAQGGKSALGFLHIPWYLVSAIRVFANSDGRGSRGRGDAALAALSQGASGVHRSRREHTQRQRPQAPAPRRRGPRSI